MTSDDHFTSLLQFYLQPNGRMKTYVLSHTVVMRNDCATCLITVKQALVNISSPLCKALWTVLFLPLFFHANELSLTGLTYWVNLTYWKSQIWKRGVRNYIPREMRNNLVAQHPWSKVSWERLVFHKLHVSQDPATAYTTEPNMIGSPIILWPSPQI